ncbi:MAG: transketolase [Clostridia bacterium]|nr:transketolase [Clostridia bacterium]
MNSNLIELNKTANVIRQDIVKMIHAANSGHPGGSLSAADIMTALYFEVMDIDPANPKKESRDKFVLSKGHAAPVVYATLARRGFFPVEELMNLRQTGAMLQGHPDMKAIPGIEMSTGSLGQGLSAAVGMAIAGQLNKDGKYVYALLGDGELNEGIIWEATMAAAHYKLGNLIAFVDYNGLQIDGKNDDVMGIKPLDKKFEAFGWDVQIVDGHSIEAIVAAVEKAKTVAGQPSMIIANTVKGKGVSFMEDQAGWHGKAPSNEELEKAIADLGGAL